MSREKVITCMQWFQIMSTSEVMLGSFLMKQNVFSPPTAPAHLNMAQFQGLSEAGRGQAGASYMLRTICSCSMQQLCKPPWQIEYPHSFHESAGWSHGSPNNTKGSALSTWRHVGSGCKGMTSVIFTGSGAYTAKHHLVRSHTHIRAHTRARMCF